MGSLPVLSDGGPLGCASGALSVWHWKCHVVTLLVVLLTMTSCWHDPINALTTLTLSTKPQNVLLAGIQGLTYAPEGRPCRLAADSAVCTL